MSEEIVTRKKAEIQEEHDGRVEKNTRVSSDLISLLIRARMAADLRPDQTLSDEERKGVQMIVRE
jgi:hypothetical protein